MMCDVVPRVNPDFKVHGHVKVEVRNTDGSLAQCEEHDNYVSPFVYGALRKVTNSRFMQLEHVSSTSTTVTTNLARINSSIYMRVGLNTGLTLTDYAGVANERERVIHGNALVPMAGMVQAVARIMRVRSTRLRVIRRRTLSVSFMISPPLRRTVVSRVSTPPCSQVISTTFTAPAC